MHNLAREVEVLIKKYEKENPQVAINSIETIKTPTSFGTYVTTSVVIETSTSFDK